MEGDGRRVGTIAGGLLLVGGGVGLGATLHHWLGDGSVDWGTAGEWVGAVLTAVVLVSGVVAFLTERAHTQQALAEARRANDLEAERWRRDQTDHEREQADRVGCYYIRVSDGAISVRCRNDSTALIYDVQAFAIVDGMEIRKQVVQPNRGIETNDLPPAGGPRLPPGAEVTFILLIDDDDIWNHVLVPNVYGITFGDNAGRWWRKWGSLELEPFDERPPTTQRAIPYVSAERAAGQAQG